MSNHIDNEYIYILYIYIYCVYIYISYSCVHTCISTYAYGHSIWGRHRQAQLASRPLIQEIISCMTIIGIEWEYIM